MPILLLPAWLAVLTGRSQSPAKPVTPKNGSLILLVVLPNPCWEQLAELLGAAGLLQPGGMSSSWVFLEEESHPNPQHPVT